MNATVCVATKKINNKICAIIYKNYFCTKTRSTRIKIWYMHKGLLKEIDSSAHKFFTKFLKIDKTLLPPLRNMIDYIMWNGISLLDKSHTFGPTINNFEEQYKFVCFDPNDFWGNECRCYATTPFSQNIWSESKNQITVRILGLS